jgi:hypothetical protein
MDIAAKEKHKNKNDFIFQIDPPGKNKNSKLLPQKYHLFS